MVLDEVAAVSIRSRSYREKFRLVQQAGWSPIGFFPFEPELLLSAGGFLDEGGFFVEPGIASLFLGAAGGTFGPLGPSVFFAAMRFKPLRW